MDHDQPAPLVGEEAPRQRLRALRIALKLSQQHVADHSKPVEDGFDRTEVNKIENGAKSLTFLSRSRLAAGLGVALVDLEAVLAGTLSPEELAARTFGAVGSTSQTPAA